MSGVTILGMVGSIIILLALFEMMRRHRLREKYALIWALVALAIITVAAFPSLLFRTSQALGLEVPANLLFFGASMVIMVLTLQHSSELGRLEERTRTLAEEIALLRLEIDQHRAADSSPHLGRPSGRVQPHRRDRRVTAAGTGPTVGPLEVFVPFWGDPELLYATIDSVKAQTDTDWTMVVVDDCYPDPTVAEHFATEDDPRIRYVRNEVNVGITDNYQRCREMASGELMMFLGCDDLMHPTFVETVKAAHREFPTAATIQVGVQVVDEHGTPIDPLTDKVKRAIRPSVDRRTELSGERLAASLLRGAGTTGPPWSSAPRRSAATPSARGCRSSRTSPC